MKLVFENSRKGQQFAILFANLKYFTDNVCMFFKEHEVYIQCLDDSHCCLLECKLHASWFKEYSFDTETDQANIGVNIAMLNKVLSTLNESQELSIETTADSDKLCINFENGTVKMGHFNKYFELPLVNITHEIMDVVLFDTKVDLKIESKIFCALISQLTVFDNNLTMKFDENKIECMSSGTEGTMKASIRIEDVKEYAITENETLEQMYSLRYVQLMCQFNKLATVMEMGFNDESPMIMKYRLDVPPAIEQNGDKEEEEEDKANKESFVRIHLAPKIKDEEV